MRRPDILCVDIPNQGLKAQVQFGKVIQIIDHGFVEAYVKYFDADTFDCPAFVRKALGFPLAQNPLDPDFSAIERKKLGLKLQSYHLEIYEQEAQNAGYPFFHDP
jgi:hypothetical protein